MCLPWTVYVSWNVLHVLAAVLLYLLATCIWIPLYTYSMCYVLQWWLLTGWLAMSRAGLGLVRPVTEDYFRVTVDDHGTYKLWVLDDLWLRSAPSFITTAHQHYTTADGSLELVDMTRDSGVDVLGYWHLSAFTYQPRGARQRVVLTVKWYQERPLVLFGQTFPDGLEGASIGNHHGVSSGFPSFYIEDRAQIGRRTELGYLAFGGIMSGDTEKHIGVWNNASKMESGLDSGPLVLFDTGSNAVILAPFTNFMSASAQYAVRQGAMTVTWGLLGAADHVPKGFSYWTAIEWSNGVNALMDDWGQTMRTYYNKDTSFTTSDWTNNYLSYWTDRGGYYYYVTEGDTNYEDTILAVKAYADKTGLPFRNIEFDSWFYPKGPGRSGGGVIEWTSMMDIFPNGLKYVWEKTGWPVIAHNRWWSNFTVYAKQNGGQYDFIVENRSGIALPISQEFWNDLMTTSKVWGLVSYEQDWLNVQFNRMEATKSSLTLGRQWLHQMGAAAARTGVTVQYCMASARHILASLELASITQARVSKDYLPGNSNWRIGITSMFAHAMGLAPYKDNFWSTPVQPGNVYNRSEPHTRLQVLVATLSTGPVCPSDRIGYMDKQLILRCCNKDGLILKPSKPAIALDKQLVLAAFSSFRGEIWATYSSIRGLSQLPDLNFGVILAAGFSATEEVYLAKSEAGLGISGLWVVSIFSQEIPTSLRNFTEDHPLLLSGCSSKNFCLYYTTPLITVGNHSVYILGELEKFVPMSPQRVRGISVSLYDVTLSLVGAAMETITITTSIDTAITNVTCTLGQAGTAELSVLKKSCHRW